MRKPNYNMERKDRDRAKQAKAAAKLEKRAAKGSENREPGDPATAEDLPAEQQPGTREGEG
jgi:hypothetical protein